MAWLTRSVELYRTDNRIGLSAEKFDTETGDLLSYTDIFWQPVAAGIVHEFDGSLSGSYKIIGDGDDQDRVASWGTFHNCIYGASAIEIVIDLDYANGENYIQWGIQTISHSPPGPAYWILISSPNYVIIPWQTIIRSTPYDNISKTIYLSAFQILDGVETYIPSVNDRQAIWDATPLNDGLSAYMEDGSEYIFGSAGPITLLSSISVSADKFVEQAHLLKLYHAPWYVDTENYQPAAYFNFTIPTAYSYNLYNYQIGSNIINAKLNTNTQTDDLLWIIDYYGTDSFSDTVSAFSGLPLDSSNMILFDDTTHQSSVGTKQDISDITIKVNDFSKTYTIGISSAIGVYYGEKFTPTYELTVDSVIDINITPVYISNILKTYKVGMYGVTDNITHNLTYEQEVAWDFYAIPPAIVNEPDGTTDIRIYNNNNLLLTEKTHTGRAQSESILHVEAPISEWVLELDTPIIREFEFTARAVSSVEIDTIPFDIYPIECLSGDIIFTMSNCEDVRWYVNDAMYDTNRLEIELTEATTIYCAAKSFVWGKFYTDTGEVLNGQLSDVPDGLSAFEVNHAPNLKGNIIDLSPYNLDYLTINNNDNILGRVNDLYTRRSKVHEHVRIDLIEHPSYQDVVESLNISGCSNIKFDLTNITYSGTANTYTGMWPIYMITVLQNYYTPNGEYWGDRYVPPPTGNVWAAIIHPVFRKVILGGSDGEGVEWYCSWSHSGLYNPLIPVEYIDISNSSIDPNTDFLYYFKLKYIYMNNNPTLDIHKIYGILNRLAVRYTDTINAVNPPVYDGVFSCDYPLDKFDPESEFKLARICDFKTILEDRGWTIELNINGDGNPCTSV